MLTSRLEAFSDGVLAIFRTPSGERLREALGRDTKGKLSMWLVPDRRVEHYLEAAGER